MTIGARRHAMIPSCHAKFEALIGHAARHRCGPQWLYLSPTLRHIERVPCAEFERLEAEYQNACKMEGTHNG